MTEVEKNAICSSASHRRGALAVISAAAVFGTAGLFVKTLALPPSIIACFRVLVPTLLLLLVRREELKPIFAGPSRLLLLASVFTAARIFLWVLGLLFAPMSQAIVILYTWPLFATVFSVVLLGEKISLRNVVLLLAAFTGIVLFVAPGEVSLGEHHYLGLLCMFGVAILSAVNFTVFKKKLAGHSPTQILFYDNCVGAVLFLPFLLLNLSSVTVSAGLYATVYGLLIGYVGYFLLYVGLSLIKASTAALLGYTEVLVASLLGVIWFEESWSWRMSVGAALILSATLSARRGTTK